MTQFIAVGLTSGGAGGGGTQSGQIRVDGKYFRDEAGALWRYRGASMFLLYRRWLMGEDISAQLGWCVRQGVNIVRVLGMVAWKGQEFGPTTPGYWDRLVPFVRRVAQSGLRVEWVAFADAQYVPGIGDQRSFLRRVVNTIGPEWNVFIEICNEPFKNGVNPDAIWSKDDPRPCPMATGNYTPAVVQGADGTWIAHLEKLDYVTLHTSRDPVGWCRKAKDLLEYRDGAGDGLAENTARLDALNCPIVDDEPMGAAEANDPGRRSNVPDDHFYHHAVAMIFSAGSTFHSDAGLQGEIPWGRQQACADAVTKAWSVVPVEYQQGQYTRGGLASLPLVFHEEEFPEESSRLYGMILGGQACCVACKPTKFWLAKAVDGWSIATQDGPMASVVLLRR